MNEQKIGKPVNYYITVYDDKDGVKCIFLFN